MADDTLSAALAEIRDRNEERIRFHRYTEYTVAHDVAEGDVRRLLAALDAVLAMHRPVRTYGEVNPNPGQWCAHGPDYDGDRHFEAGDGIWYCKDDPAVTVCSTCTSLDIQGSVFWPCEEYEAITSALTGEANDG